MGLMERLLHRIGFGTRVHSTRDATPTEEQIAAVAGMSQQQLEAYVALHPEHLQQVLAARKILRSRAAAGRQVARGPRCAIGSATGEFARRNAAAAMAEGEQIVMDCYDLYEGLVCIGKPGSGKTRAILQPLARDWLRDPSAGLLANGIKWSWAATIEDIARYCGRSADQIHRIGPGAQRWSILHGLSPDAIGRFLRASFDLAARGHGASGSAQFFHDSAANIVTAIAQILDAACVDGAVEVTFEGDGWSETIAYHYGLDSIYDVSFLAKSPEKWDTFSERMRLRAKRLKEAGRVDHAVAVLDGVDAVTRELASMEAAETKDGIMGQIATALSLFRSNREIRETFCGEERFNLRWLDSGHVIIIDVDLETYPRAAELVYLLAFQHLAQNAMRRDRDGVTNPVMLMMDEFTSACTNTMTTAFQTARSANIAVVIAFQSLAKLEHQLGSKTAANAMVGTLRNLICYTADEDTLKLLSAQIGKAEIIITDTSDTSGWSAGQLMPQNGGMNVGTSRTNRTEYRDIVDPSIFRGLRNTMRRGTPLNEQIADAVCSLTVSKVNRDGVVITRPWDPPAKNRRTA